MKSTHFSPANLEVVKISFKFMNAFRAFQLIMETVKTRGDMTMRNLGNVRVLLVKVKYTYLSSIVIFRNSPKMMR